MHSARRSNVSSVSHLLNTAETGLKGLSRAWRDPPEVDRMVLVPVVCLSRFWMGRKNETWQGNKDHGRRRSQRAASFCLRRGCHSTEVTLAMSTLLQMVVPDAPQNLTGDNAYDSDRLDAELRFYGIEVIAPHRRNRRNSTQDGRRLKRYRRRWKIERLFAWLQNFRRLVVSMNVTPRTFSGCFNSPRL